MARVIKHGVVSGTSQSDHAPIMLEISLKDGDVEDSRKGMGVWHLNLDLLSEPGLQEKNTGLWLQQQQEIGKGGLAKLLKALNDTMKEMKTVGIQKAQERHAKELAARQKVETLQHAIENGQDLSEALLAELDEAKFLLSMIDHQKARGWFRRAKLKWAAEGDLPRRYFFARRKQRRFPLSLMPRVDCNGDKRS